MSNLTDKIKATAIQLAESLLCETHPNVCALRDSDPNHLAEKVVEIIAGATDRIVTVQGAFAILEQTLTEAAA